MRSVWEIEEDYSQLKLKVAKGELTAENVSPLIDALHQEIQVSKHQLLSDEYLENSEGPEKGFKSQVDRIFKNR